MISQSVFAGGDGADVEVEVDGQGVGVAEPVVSGVAAEVPEDAVAVGVIVVLMA